MKKIISLTLFILLTLNVSTVVFADNDGTKDAVNPNVKQTSESADNFDFDENSFNISDEQFTDSITTSENLLEEKTDFRTQIINSSHFTPNSPYKNARGSREENK